MKLMNHPKTGEIDGRVALQGDDARFLFEALLSLERATTESAAAAKHPEFKEWAARDLERIARMKAQFQIVHEATR